MHQAPIREPVTIISESQAQAGQRYRSFWYLGWAWAALMAVVCSFAGGHQLAWHQALGEARLCLQAAQEIAEHQKAVSGALETAWRQHGEEIRMVTSWAEYIKERDDLSKYNRGEKKAFSRK